MCSCKIREDTSPQKQHYMLYCVLHPTVLIKLFRLLQICLSLDSHSILFSEVSFTVLLET